MWTNYLFKNNKSCALVGQKHQTSNIKQQQQQQQELRMFVFHLHDQPSEILQSSVCHIDG